MHIYVCRNVILVLLCMDTWAVLMCIGSIHLLKVSEQFRCSPGESRKCHFAESDKGCVCVCVCVCVCAYVCMYVCMYFCMYVLCMYVHT